jgi:outer membrane protein assembly factor BamB
MKRNFVSKKTFFYAFFLSAAIFGSCVNNDADSAEIKIPSYKTKVLWERGMLITSITESPPLINGEYLYFPSDNIPGGGSSITKINLENGKVLWETEGLWDHEREQLQKIGEYIYFPVVTGLVYVLNDSDGKLAATIMLGNDKTEARSNRVVWDSTAVSGTYLFWSGPYHRDVPEQGLLRLSTNNIDFSKAPDEIQTILPDLIWSSKNESYIHANIISDNGTLYFIASTYRYSEIQHIPVLTALDAATLEVRWNHKMPHIVDPYYYPLFMNGENLIVFDETISCYKKSTGEPIYENKQLKYYHEDWIIKNGTLYNNCLFYTTRDEIVSINADTGILVWCTPVKNVYFNHFQINMGKMYFLTDEGLFVYNADDGKLFGMDKKFKFTYPTQQFDLMYKDTVIFLNEQSYGYYLTSIRCE